MGDYGATDRGISAQPSAPALKSQNRGIHSKNLRYASQRKQESNNCIFYFRRDSEKSSIHPRKRETGSWMGPSLTKDGSVAPLTITVPQLPGGGS